MTTAPLRSPTLLTCAALATALTVGPGCGGTTAPSAAPAAAEPTPAAPSPAQIADVGPLVDEIDPTVREAVRPRMVRHGKDLADLYGAMRAGDRAEVARLAAAIAAEPDIAEAGPPDSVNAMIPAAFFEGQRRLERRARDLADVAGATDGALGPAFESLADACDACHAPR